MQQQTTAPPSTLWEAVWPTVEPALTPETVGGIVLTLAITHAAKQVSVALQPRVAASLDRWRAFCTLLSIIVGTGVGFAIWAMSDTGWLVVPVCALLSGPVWRIITALLPEKIGNAFLTATDRRFRKEDT